MTTSQLAAPGPHEELVCETCKNPKLWHDSQPEGAIRHPFNPGNLPASATFGKRDQRGKDPRAGTVQAQPASVPFPFDPVLRMALIRKGVITPDDLRDAELAIQATTGQMIAEAERGQQAT
jgi:hypothetical protein